MRGLPGGWCSAGLLLGLVACAASSGAPKATAGSAADPNHQTYRYCAGTVTEWEVHRCVWELTPEQQRRRSYSQRLVFRGQQLVRFDTVTGSGALYKGEESNTYRYENGRIREWSETNWNGVHKGGGVLSQDMQRVTLLDHLGRPRPDKDARDGWVDTSSGWLRKLDQRGRVLEVAYLDHQGRPTPEHGVYMMRVKRDERGALLERSYFGKDGEPVNGKLGVHRIVSTVDDRNFPTVERYFDGPGKPALSKGAHYVRSESNDVSETVAQAWFDAQDRPVRSDVYGAASVRMTHDERGNEILLELFDEQGRPTLGKDSFASRKRRFDAQDRAIEWSYFGVRGEPVRNKHGDVVVRQQRDARGNVVLERSFDEHAAPIANEDGYHSVEIGYDERDNPISYRYADVARQPTLGKLGYAAKRLRYDGDRLVSTSYFDTSDRPVDVPAGFATVHYQFGSDGNESARLYYDMNQKPVQICRGKVPQALQDELRARGSNARQCYEQLLQQRRDARGRVVLELRIGTAGEVLASKLSADELQDAQFSSCVLDQFRAAFQQVPENGCAEVRMPLAFVPKPPEASAP